MRCTGTTVFRMCIVGGLSLLTVGCVASTRLEKRVADLEKAVAARDSADPLANPRCGSITCDVSAIDLVVRPYRYHGQHISVYMYFVAGFETAALYPSKDLAGASKGIWCNCFPDSANGHYVYISGIFKAGPAGHLGASVGEFTSISFKKVFPNPGENDASPQQ